MSKGRKNNLKDALRPPRLPSVVMEDEETSRAHFLEAMAKLEGATLPDKDAAWEKALRESPTSRPESKNSSNITVDLHGLTLEEAKDLVQIRLTTLLKNQGGQVTVTIITGKGKHSGPRGSVLAQGIHSFVRRQFDAAIVYIEESPADLVVGQFPIRGHFRVTLKRPKNF